MFDEGRLDRRPSPAPPWMRPDACYTWWSNRGQASWAKRRLASRLSVGDAGFRRRRREISDEDLEGNLLDHAPLIIDYDYVALIA